MNFPRFHVPGHATSLRRSTLAVAAILLTGWISLNSPSTNAAPVRDGAVSADLISEISDIEPAKPFTIALRLSIDPGWHTYWINPGDSGLPTKITWTLPPGFTAGPIQFTYPHRFTVDFGGLKQVGLGYETEAIHLVEITPPADLAPGSTVTLSGRADWLMCDDMQCVPGGADLSLTLSVGTAATPSPDAPAISKARAAQPRPADGWSLSAAASLPKQFTFTITPPAPASLPDPGSITLYPESQGIIDLNAPQRFQSAAGALSLTVPQSPYAAELPPSLAVILISEAGFPDFGGAKAIRISQSPPAAPSATAPATAPASAITPSPAPEPAPSTPAAPPQADSGAPVTVDDDAPFGGGLLGYLIAGFLGGAILNVMPCVFPVISLKILSFVSHAGESRRKVLLHGAAYTVGILMFFLGFAAILIVVQAGWGAFQFQSPAFVMTMAALIVVLSLSLFGVFEFGLKLTGVGGKLTQGSGYAGSFWSGALAVVLATPCTGPFLGSSLGWAFTQPPVVNLTFFTFMGLGMAAPYVLLTAFPALTRWLPRPGVWMETFKQVMGFPMLGAAVYLLWILEGQIGDKGQAFFMGALILLSLAAWSWGRFSHPAASPRSRRTGLATMTLAIIGAVGLSIHATRQTTQANESEGAAADTRPIAEIIDSHRRAGKHVFVDFTARWCAICQTNKPAMYSEETKAAFARYGVEFVVADWTNKSDDIFQFLKKYGRRSVPYYPLFPADLTKGPVELPQNLTNGVILDHLKRLETIDTAFPPAITPAG